jgi:hypothetical protein
MSPAANVLLAGFLACFLAAFASFHLMIVRANRGLPNDERIPHSLQWGDWKRLEKSYKSFYPGSNLYALTLSAAAAALVLALATFCVRFYEVLFLR